MSTAKPGAPLWTARVREVLGGVRSAGSRELAESLGVTKRYASILLGGMLRRGVIRLVERGGRGRLNSRQSRWALPDRHGEPPTQTLA